MPTPLFHGLSPISGCCTPAHSPRSCGNSPVWVPGANVQMASSECQPIQMQTGADSSALRGGDQHQGRKSFLQEASPWTPGLHLYETKVHGPLSLSDFMPAESQNIPGRQVGAGRDTEAQRGNNGLLITQRSSAEAPPREVRVPRGCEALNPSIHLP